MTNYERIKNMSIEEMAEFIPNWSYTEACDCSKEYVVCGNDCEKCVMSWLKKEQGK